jgi:hypothetical protein
VCVRPLLHMSTELHRNAWEADAAMLDEVALRLGNDSRLKADIIVYGGEHGYRNEVRVRLREYGDYLMRDRAVAQDRVSLRAGGYRSSAMIEIWLLAPDSCPAPATPTIPSNRIVFLPGRFAIVRV